MMGHGKGAHIEEGPATGKALGKPWVGDMIPAPRELTVWGQQGGSMGPEMALQSQAQRREGLTELKEAQPGGWTLSSPARTQGDARAERQPGRFSWGQAGGGGGPTCHARENIEGTYRWKGKEGDAD